jgi:MarR family transcriptional regulator, organic hydroperoxide resistance regulator
MLQSRDLGQVLRRTSESFVSKDTSSGATMVAAEDELRLENQLIFAIYNSANKVARLWRPLLDPFGLTFPQYLTLLALWGRPPCTVSDLSRLLNLESNTLTPLLKRLESTGYVARQRDSDDERRVRISLTPKGDAFRTEALALRGRLIRDLSIPDQDLTSLKTGLQQFTQRLDTLTQPVLEEALSLASKRHA